MFLPITSSYYFEMGFVYISLSNFWHCYQEHENERQRLVMEKDASVKELASLESQLASLEAHIGALSEEVNKQKAEVKDKSVSLSLSTFLYI